MRASSRRGASTSSSTTGAATARLPRIRSLEEAQKPYRKHGGNRAAISIATWCSTSASTAATKCGSGEATWAANAGEPRATWGWRKTRSFRASTVLPSRMPRTLSTRGPERWNDPDYILIGYVGDARKTGCTLPTDKSDRG